MRAAPYRDIILSWVSQTAGGVLTWAQTLVAGNQSGGNDPTITAGDSLLFDGLRDQPAASHTMDEGTPSAPVYTISGADIAGAVGAAATSISIGTGAASALAAGDGPASGLLYLVTGDSTDGAGTAGPSGLILIRSGTVTSATGTVASGSILVGSGTVSGGSRRSGEVLIKSGDSTTTGATGNARLMSGDNTTGNSGHVRVESGTATLGNSGAMFYGSGGAPAGISGNVNITSGSAGLGSGSLIVSTGTSAEAGPIDIYGGLSTAAVGPAVSIRGGISGLSVGGPLALSGGEGPTGRGDLEVGTQNTLTITGVVAQRVAGRYTEWYTDGFATPANRQVWAKRITVAVRTVPAGIDDDPDFEYETNTGGLTQDSTFRGLTLIQSTPSLGEYSVVRTGVTAGASSWGKTSLTRASRYSVGGTAIGGTTGRMEMGARPTTNAFDNTTDDNKTILVFEPLVYGPNWQAVTSNAGVDTVQDTGIAASGVAVNYLIAITDANRAEYWITDAARGGDMVMVASHAVGAGLSGCILYAGAICTAGGSSSALEWGNPRQAVNLT